MATNGQAAAGGWQSDAPHHLCHLHVGSLPLSMSREQEWVTVAVVGCPAWPAGSGTAGWCANILQVKPWKLLGVSREADFCFVGL